MTADEAIHHLKTRDAFSDPSDDHQAAMALVMEVERLREDLLEVARATGIYYAAHGVADHPGPIEQIVGCIVDTQIEAAELREQVAELEFELLDDESREEIERTREVPT